MVACRCKKVASLGYWYPGSTLAIGLPRVFVLEISNTARCRCGADKSMKFHAVVDRDGPVRVSRLAGQITVACAVTC